MVDYAQIEGPVQGAYLKVKFNGVFIAGVKSVKKDPKIDKKDITAAKNTLGGKVTYKSYAPTLIDNSITLNLAYRNLADPGQKALYDNLGGEAAELRVYEDDTHYWFCDCWVESFPDEIAVDGIQGEGVSIGLQMQDADGIQYPATA
ncbi:MAG: hypothetical protein AB9879_09705 [Methanothrix sp.]